MEARLSKVKGGGETFATKSALLLCKTHFRFLTNGSPKHSQAESRGFPGPSASSQAALPLHGTQ